MPASSHGLRLMAIAPSAGHGIARLILFALTLCAADPSIAQAPRRPRADHADPSSANPRSPFAMMRVFLYTHTRIYDSRDDTSTNGASALG